MNLDLVLIVLRFAAGIMLLAFVGVALRMIWRDYQAIDKEIESRTIQRGRLVVVHSSGTTIKLGTTFPLMPLTSLGRSQTNTVALNDTFASAEHALLTLRGGQWWLEDRGSSNGTLLNGYRIEEPVVVSTGDTIAVGQVELKIELA